LLHDFNVCDFFSNHFEPQSFQSCLILLKGHVEFSQIRNLRP
jgi:hypothetical protein